MLFIYIYAFAGGSLMLVILRKVVPLQYGLLALGVNLFFILLFSRIL
jgi:hypothetical protein